MDIKIGQRVFSKRGRDKGKAFVVLSVEGEYVFLADGRLRPLSKAKKKKLRHIQPTKREIGETGGLTDAGIRKWLAVMNQEEDI